MISAYYNNADKKNYVFSGIGALTADEVTSAQQFNTSKASIEFIIPKNSLTNNSPNLLTGTVTVPRDTASIAPVLNFNEDYFTTKTEIINGGKSVSDLNSNTKGYNSSDFRLTASWAADDMVPYINGSTAPILYSKYGPINTLTYNLCTQAIQYDNSTKAITGRPTGPGRVMFRFASSADSSFVTYGMAKVGVSNHQYITGSLPGQSNGNALALYKDNRIYHPAKVILSAGAVYWMDYSPFINEFTSNVNAVYYHIAGEFNWLEY